MMFSYYIYLFVKGLFYVIILKYCAKYEQKNLKMH